MNKLLGSNNLARDAVLPSVPLLRFTPANIPPCSCLAWAEGRQFAIPATLAEAIGLKEAVGPEGRLDLSGGPPALAADAATRLRLHAAFIDPARLPRTQSLACRLVPRPWRVHLAKLLGGWRRRSWRLERAFPAWPQDLSGDCLGDLPAVARPPRSGPTPVLLTHDVDTSTGLHALRRVFLPLEERYGVRSTNFVVPLSFPLDHGLLGEIVARGHEIGVHGCDHAGRTPFAPPEVMVDRLDRGLAALERHRPVGYRSPSLLRTPALLSALATRYRYDSSMPNSGGVFPYPDNGCPSARPFRIGRLTELPISLPRDMALTFMGYAPRDILSLWQDCLEQVRLSGGVAILLVHPEPYYSGSRTMRGIYERFLEGLVDASRYRCLTARQFLDANEWAMDKGDAGECGL